MTPAAVAWGDIATTRLPIAVETGRHFVFSGSGTPDGRYLIGSVVRDNFLDTTSTTPGEVVLYNIAAASIENIAAMQAPNSQVLSAAADDNWIAWMESDDLDGYNWHLFAADRASGALHEVAKAARKDGNAVPSPLTFVALSHGNIVWGQGIGSGVSKGDVSNAVIRRYDLATSKTDTLATAAGSPSLSWPWAAWDEFPTRGDPRAVVKNLETGVQQTLSTLPATIVLEGQSAAFSAKDLHSISLIDDVSHASAAVEVAHGVDDADYLQWPSLNDRLVAWSQDDASVVFDRAQRRLVQLPVIEGWSSGTAAGPNVVWFETDPGHASNDHADWVVVADTRRFPTSP